MSRTVVIGPPGTGKTSFLVGRVVAGTRFPGIVAELLRNGVAPEEIAFLSYSRNAIREARDRVEAITGIAAKEFTAFRTLHSSWTRALGLQKSQFLQRDDWREFLEQFGYDVTPHSEEEIDDGTTPTVNDTPGDTMLAAWDWCRAVLCGPEHAGNKLGRFITEQEFKSFTRDYEEFKQAKRKMDFTDVIARAYADRLQLHSSYLLVDEAQDLSPLQVATLEPSIADATRAWVVGDPDQSIYAFQGCSPRWIMSLWNNQTWTREVLGKSYRCPEPIRRAAASVIGACRERLPVEYAPRDGSGRYEVGVSWDAALQELANQLESYVLARTGKFCGSAACELFDGEIPYIATRGRGPNPLGRDRLLRAIKTLHQIGEGKPVPMVDAAATVDLIPHDAGKVHHGWVMYGAKTKLKNATITTLHQIDYEKYGIAGLAVQCKTDPWLPLEQRHPPRRDGRSELRWLRECWKRNGGSFPKPCVTVTTWHNSKGSEADLVVIDPSLSRPCAMELYGPDADSEHRCAYVAVTRARHTCLILDRSQDAYGSYPFPRPA